MKYSYDICADKNVINVLDYKRRKHSKHHKEEIMGLFGNIIKKAVSEGIGNAVEKAVESAVKPAAERFAGNVAEQFNSAAESIESTNTEKTSESGFDRLEQAAQHYADAVSAKVWSQFLGEFPKWEFTPVTDSYDDEGDDYFLISITVSATHEMLRKYKETLASSGFSGSDQIMRKIINGVEHCVDFTFAEESDECQIRYALNK